MKLKELLRCFSIPDGIGEVWVERISRDPTDANASALFVLAGRNFDPVEISKKAEASGAVAVISDRELFIKNVPTLRVANARSAYAHAFAAICGDPQKSMEIYGITGTNGKTSTSYFLQAILKYCGCDTALIGTTGIIVNGQKEPFPPEDSGITQMTTPDPEILYPLLRKLVSQGIRHAVMEVSSHSLALGKVDPIRFKVGIFTNFSRDHLDFHGSMERYLDAKLKLVSLSEKVVYNGDDSTLYRSLADRGAVSYGTDRGDYLGCCVRKNEMLGVSYILRYDGAAMRIESPICGDFTVENTLAAVAAAIEGGCRPEAVCDAIAAVAAVPGRLQRVPLDGNRFPFSVIIDYAHTPYALEKLLKCEVFTARKGRLITLFGCGGDRDKGKRAQMGRIAEKYSDRVFITSDNPRGEDPFAIISDVISGMNDKKNYTVIPDREDAITLAFNECEKGDVLLLVGKGHETYMVDRSGRRSFSETDIVLRAAQGKLKKGKDHEL